MNRLASILITLMSAVVSTPLIFLCLIAIGENSQLVADSFLVFQFGISILLGVFLLFWGQSEEEVNDILCAVGVRCILGPFLFFLLA